MSLAEEFSKLETTDASLSQRLVQSWKRKLNVSREPELLSELIDYQLATQSKPALRILLGTKDLYSQDFFAKINDCLHRQSTCLQALRLLSHMLTGQTSWLYKIVHSAAFPTLLKLLRPIHSVSIITSAVYLLCALIPLNPYHVTPHLPDIYESFTLLATLNGGGERKMAEEVLLSVKVAVYFLFLQLYSLYPCSFVQYLKGRFGPTGEVHIYQEHIAPLFQFVQLHPNLIVEVPSQETQRTKWSSKDPSEIATLSLSLCIDPNLVSRDNENDTVTCKTTTKGDNTGSLLQLPLDQRYCGHLSSNELSEMSSPSLVFSQVAPPPSNTPGSQSDCVSLLTLPSVTPTATPTSISEPVSLDNSVQNTPLLRMRQSPFFNYSPTASIEPDALSLVTSEVQELPNEKSGVGVLGGVASSSANTPSSGRHSFSHSSSTVVGKSFSERLTGMIFRRKSSDEGGERGEEQGEEAKEEFANISVSECDQCNHGNHQRGSGAYTDSLSQSPTPPRDEDRGKSDCNNPINIQSMETNAVPPPPHITMSCSSVEETVLLASQKLQRIAETREETRAREEPSAKGRVGGEVTPPSRDPLLVSRTVLKDKRENTSPFLNVSSSPLTALDVFIQTGFMLHKSDSRKPQGLSLSDLEAMDWDYFGCCPHIEELRVLSQLLSSLHSQVLFERYQCQVHSKRNRRLMTKARHVNKLENEIVTLRHRLHQQEELIRCLKAEAEVKRESKVIDRGAEVNSLLRERLSLQEQVKAYQQQVGQLQAKNQELSQSLQGSQGQVFALKTKIEELKIKLSLGEKLKTEVESLNKEHLLLEELYHQQKLSLSTLRRENVTTQQTKELNETLLKDKEAADNLVSALKREVSKLKMSLKDRDGDIEQKEAQIAALKESFLKAQEKYTEKAKSLESKYQCIKNINQELEESLFSCKTRPIHRSRHHKRSESSHLSHSLSVTPTNVGQVTPTM